MDYGDYSSDAVELAVDLANARPRTPDELAEFVAGHQDWFERRPKRLPDDEREKIAELAERAHAVFGAESENDIIEQLNVLLARYRPDPRLTVHDGTLHVHYTDERASLIEQLTVNVAVGLTMFVTGFGWQRLGHCDAPDCDSVYVDTSRNRRRRYCSDTCASRVTVAAYRARKRESA